MIKINAIPAFEDNYFWVIQPSPEEKAAVVVDPGDAQPALDYLQRNSLELAAILLTHRHHDHIGGVNGLVKEYPVEVYGPPTPAIPQVSVPLEDGQHFEFAGIGFDVMAVPGHTWEHIAYYLPQHNALFCGDTLFAAGCGRRFDQAVAAETMWDSLQKLASLPQETLVYCAHEYTLSNLQFAAAVEPDNEDIAKRLVQVQSLRAGGQMTLPSTIALEKLTNPFLRCREPGVQAFAQARSSSELTSAGAVFAALRQAKDFW